MNKFKDRIRRKLKNKIQLSSKEQEKYTAMCRAAAGVKRAQENKPKGIFVISPEGVDLVMSATALELKEERERKERLAFIEAQGWKLVSGRWRTAKGHFVKKGDLEKAGL